ncbi:hypothetical protein D9M72_641590 [compost metagenome]
MAVPTERSMPPAETAKVMAIATMARSAKLLTSTLSRLAPERNAGASHAKRTKTVASAAMSAWCPMMRVTVAMETDVL